MVSVSGPDGFRPSDPRQKLDQAIVGEVKRLWRRYEKPFYVAR